MSIRDQVLEKIPEIPSLPAAATEVLRMVEDPDSSIGDIMAAIEYDPVLTTEILRLANTAYFAGPRQIATLREAGVLFGTQRVLQLVLATSVLPIARHPLNGYDLPAGKLVRHCMAVAIGAERLAALCGKVPPAHTFTSGLLSDIGKIVLGSFLEVDVRPVLDLALDRGISFEIAEQTVLGIDHAEVGALLLQTWNLPENVVQAVRWHHDPERHPGERAAVDLVHVASVLSAGSGIGAGIDGLNYRACTGSLERLNASHEILERATCDMLSGLEDIQHQLPAGE